MSSFKAYYLAKEQAREKTLLVVTATEKTAGAFVSDLEFFSAGRAKAEVCLFPPPDVVPYTRLVIEPDIWIDRLRILYKLYLGKPLAIVAPIHAILRRSPPKWIFQKYCRTIRLHDTLDRNELTRFLMEAGYINQPLVEDEGTFGFRGGIVDIFSPAMDRPTRLELDGDEIVSIRTFDPSTQKSSFGISSLTIIPARNVILNEETKARMIGSLKSLCDKYEIKSSERRELAEAIEHGFYAPAVDTLMPLFYEKTASIVDYLSENAPIYGDDEIEVNAEAEKLMLRLKDAHAAASHIEKIVGPEELYDKNIQLPPLPFHLVGGTVSTYEVEWEREGVKPQLNTILDRIHHWQQAGLSVIITSHTTTQAERLLDILKFHGLHAEITERPFYDVAQLHKSTAWIMLGKVSGGFVSEDDRLALLTDEDIFGSKVSKRPAETRAFETFTDFSELTDGDCIIHKDHGIGRYMGLKNMEIAGTKNDFLELHYLGGDKLYLPIWKINLISRYVGAGYEGAVALDRLGGTRWTRAQKKVTAAIRTMAMELLKIYASREISNGFAFSPRDEMLEEFEAAFPYDETPDQWRTIEETLEGLQKERPSDRLICGDVGYGKTEVAMRATFKAVADKKQVAILVPTTVLAFQHYENFMTRFAAFPIRIEMLSRFRSKTEQKHVITDLARGTADIVIGTHRLLQKDVKFSDLGLLIIDEEHRFGVGHKERIKKLRTNVDTITMSATPIPRTLHMSLSGIRDISIINTPPVNRLAIRTYVAEFDKDLVRSAIMAELARGGQVFFVHNRVETINKFYELLVKLVPEAKIVVGHGQMNEHELEDVMIKFLQHRADILLCTTIIESGLDIPSANTIIINRADVMGLAQLYQLRGRGGRSNVQAYAYLLTPSDETISPTAKKRLTLLQRYTELGSGFQIAMHDLEIRGAGNILGAQQSGHINAIGYEMYVDLLERTIRRLRGKEESVKLDVEITFPVPAYIPTDYVEDEGQRLVLYRRLAGIASLEKLDDIAKEVVDRYGRHPQLVKNLLGIVEIRVLAKELMIETIQFDGQRFAYKFHANTRVKPEVILKMVRSNPKKFIFRQPATLIVTEVIKEAAVILGNAKTFLRSLSAD